MEREAFSRAKLSTKSSIVVEAFGLPVSTDPAYRIHGLEASIDRIDKTERRRNTEREIPNLAASRFAERCS